MDDMTVQLLPLPAEHFDDWRASTKARLIGLRQESGLLPGQDAVEDAERNFTELLPEGSDTHTSRILRIVDVEGSERGTIWCAFKDGRMFLIDVAFDAPLTDEQLDELWEMVLVIAAEEQATQISARLFLQDAEARRFLDGHGFSTSSIQMLLEPIPDRDASSVDVSPMRAERYPSFAAASEAGFASELAASGRLTPDEAAAESHRQFEHELPDGLDTPGQKLFTASVDGAEVGILWLAIRERDDHPHVFILDIEVAADQRRRGYGRALMHAAEREARRSGAGSIGLHVFGFNQGAVDLYEQLGYRRLAELLVLDV